jgi:hypothetical protein
MSGSEFTFDALKQQVLSQFSQIAPQPQVSQAEQEIELNYQSRMTRGERFYFVVDLLNFEITTRAGMQRWLGYPEKDFSYKKYWSLLHPSSQKAVMMVTKQLYMDLCSGKYPLDFMVQRFSSRVAIRHRDGHYLLTKKVSSVFQFDQQSRLLSYINEFTIVGPFKGEGLKPIFYNDFGNEEQKGGEVMSHVVDRFRKMKVFSSREYQLARISVENPDFTRKDISDIMEVGIDSVGTYSRRFLDKARNFFEVEFPTTQDAAACLRNNGLI